MEPRPTEEQVVPPSSVVGAQGATLPSSSADKKGEQSDRSELLKFLARLSLEHQEDAAEEADRIRGRILNLLGFFAAATGFLVKFAIDAQAERTGAFFVLAVIASLCVLGLTVFSWLTLRPSEWTQPDALKIANKLVFDPEVGHSEEEFYAKLIELTAGATELNEEVLDRLRKYSSAALVLGIVQVMVWASLVWVVA
jgi:hypothetical protein